MKKRRPYRWYPYPLSEIAKAKRKDWNTSPKITIDIDRVVLSIDEEFHLGMLEEVLKRRNMRKPKMHPARRRKTRDPEIKSVIRVVEPRNMHYGKRKTKRK